MRALIVARRTFVSKIKLLITYTDSMIDGYISSIGNCPMEYLSSA